MMPDKIDGKLLFHEPETRCKLRRLGWCAIIALWMGMSILFLFLDPYVGLLFLVFLSIFGAIGIYQVRTMTRFFITTKGINIGYGRDPFVKFEEMANVQDEKGRKWRTPYLRIITNRRGMMITISKKDMRHVTWYCDNPEQYSKLRKMIIQGIKNNRPKTKK